MSDDFDFSNLVSSANNLNNSGSFDDDISWLFSDVADFDATGVAGGATAGETANLSWLQTGLSLTDQFTINLKMY